VEKQSGGNEAVTGTGGPAHAESMSGAVKDRTCGKPRRVANGELHIRRRLLKKLPDITDAMLESAGNGNAGTFKLLWELGGLSKEPTSRRTKRQASLSEMLMQELTAAEGADKKKQSGNGEN